MCPPTSRYGTPGNNKRSLPQRHTCSSPKYYSTQIHRADERSSEGQSRKQKTCLSICLSRFTTQHLLINPQIRRIVDGENMPRSADRQTLLFSATFPKEIQRLAADFMTNYIFLAVGRVGSSTDLIVQHIEFINMHDKRQVLLDLVGTVEVSGDWRGNSIGA